MKENDVLKYLYGVNLPTDYSAAEPSVFSVDVPVARIDDVVKAPAGTVVHAELVNLDAAGNRSKHPSVVDFIVKDEIPPEDPSGFTFEPTGQVDE